FAASANEFLHAWQPIEKLDRVKEPAHDRLENLAHGSGQRGTKERHDAEQATGEKVDGAAKLKLDRGEDDFAEVRACERCGDRCDGIADLLADRRVINPAKPVDEGLDDGPD